MFSLKDRHKSSTSPSSSNRTSYLKSTTSSLDYSMLPKKIIKATLSYTAQHQHELSFEKGDFFHVIGRENDHHWFAVNNPLTNLTGLVPVSYFEIVDKSTRTMNAIQPIIPLDHHSGYKQGTSSPRSLQPQAQQHCYGLVLYDFVAERPDELDCKANEAIIVIAQSNKDWFVAKPIGRLGGPGLVPVSFVQLHDVITDHPVLLPTNNDPSTSKTTPPSPRSSITIPNLEDWKKQTQKYEASSLLLAGDTQETHQRKNRLSKSAGRLSLSMANSLSDQYHKYSSSRRQTKLQPSIDPISSSTSTSNSATSEHQRYSYESTHPSPRRNSEFIVVKDRKHVQRQSQLQQSSALPTTTTTTTLLDNGQPTKVMVVGVQVTSFIWHEDKYWFILHATVNNGKYRVLRRTYDCFYRSHVRLLQDFPDEAGKGEQKRILPFMPGPLDQVDDYITNQRREDLDLYCKTLLSLPAYLSACDIVQTELFGMKNGDIETDDAPSTDDPLPAGPTVKTKSAPGFDVNSNYKYSTDMYYNSGVGKVKIKIVHKDDIYAVKIPADCTLHELELRVTDRLGGVLGKMKYKDDVHHQPATYLPLETELDMEEAFILAIQRGKLTIVVEG